MIADHCIQDQRNFNLSSFENSRDIRKKHFIQNNLLDFFWWSRAFENIYWWLLILGPRSEWCAGLSTNSLGTTISWFFSRNKVLHCRHRHASRLMLGMMWRWELWGWVELATTETTNLLDVMVWGLLEGFGCSGHSTFLVVEILIVLMKRSRGNSCWRADHVEGRRWWCHGWGRLWASTI